MKKIFLKSGKESLAAVIAFSKRKPDIFFLHGGGLKREKEKLLYLMRDLARHRINSLAFDFSGVNESSGLMSESSLKKRVSEVKSIIENYYKPDQGVCLCAFSMGGYVAIKATELLKISKLVLFCPAVYDKKAYEVNFGEEFSKVIRREKSWMDTDAWKVLSEYKNDLLLFVPEKDEIVPREVSDLIYSNAENCKNKEMIILPGFTHGVHQWIPKKKKIRREIITKIVANLPKG